MSSRNEKTRSFARARSSSRRAPPSAASNPLAAIASSSVTVCSRLRDAPGPVSSTARPESIDSCTDATISRSPSSRTRRSRNSITSGKLCPVSTCRTGNGKRAGRNAFSASRSSTIESLPPENMQHRPLELGGHLAHDEDRLGFEQAEVGELAGHGA